jgi:cell filamentation protein
VYDATPDPCCYPNSNVLINRLDLRDASALEAFEADAVILRGDEPLPAGRSLL